MIYVNVYLIIKINTVKLIKIINRGNYLEKKDYDIFLSHGNSYILLLTVTFSRQKRKYLYLYIFF